MLISHGQKKLHPFIFLCRSWELKRLGEMICGFVCYTQKPLRQASLKLVSKCGLLEKRKEGNYGEIGEKIEDNLAA